MSEPSFHFDVFLSHSSKDKAVVRDLAARLKQDGILVWLDEWEIKPGDSIPAKIEEGLEHSRVLVFCMSANAFGSDWAHLESHTFRFRDPLNKERRFIPLRLDDTAIKGSLAQFLYINWGQGAREQNYPQLLEACRSISVTRAGFPSRGANQLGAGFAKLIKEKAPLPTRSETIQMNALELCAKLKTIPPLKEEDFKKDFRGFWVSWWTILSSASAHWSDSSLCNLQLQPDLPGGYINTIDCTVRLENFPILNILQRGSKIEVRGQIGDFHLFGVRLENVTITSTEQTGKSFAQ